ncbi:MAG: type II toxin-antitoxin system VapC family toxin [Pyrinomonadaceae bacterium]
MSFWDSSAIVPLCLYEANSQNARRLWRRPVSKYIAWFTPVEVMSAFARSERTGEITDQRRLVAEKLLQIIESRFELIHSEPRIVALARTFPSIYGLRSLDSLQLAAALVWCKEFPKDKDFISADAKLLESAKSVGFTIHDLS